MKTNECVKLLYGHGGTVNCLDVHADRLVSGAKDCLVKGKQLLEEEHIHQALNLSCDVHPHPDTFTRLLRHF